MKLQSENILKLLDCSNSVVCRMLGYAYGEVMATSTAGTGTIWLDNVHCTGSETTLTACPHNGWGGHDCRHDEDVSVKCHSQEPVGSGMLILRHWFCGTIQYLACVRICH